MSVLLLTGPPASGKNTIGEQLAKQMSQCAVIDADVLRRMIMQPRKHSVGDEEGHRQHLLGIENACSMAHNFTAANFDVIISDTLNDSSLAHYKQQLKDLATYTVLILPSQEEIARRLLSRPDYLSRGQVELAYTQQAAFSDYDQKLDNTELSIADAVKWVQDKWPHTN